MFSLSGHLVLFLSWGKYDTELDFLGSLQRKDAKVFIESVETELVRKWMMCVIGNF